jgi:hypothetical protein
MPSASCLRFTAPFAAVLRHGGAGTRQSNSVESSCEKEIAVLPLLSFVRTLEYARQKSTSGKVIPHIDLR